MKGDHKVSQQWIQYQWGETFWLLLYKLQTVREKLVG